MTQTGGVISIRYASTWAILSIVLFSVYVLIVFVALFHAGKGKGIAAFHRMIHVSRLTLIYGSGCSFVAYSPHFGKK